MFRGLKTALIIPALDEEEAIGQVVAAVDRDVVDQVVVADNGSVDATAERAKEAGASVVREDRRGYGSACLTAIRTVPDAELLVFLDGDGSDDPAEIPALLAALIDNDADLVIGSRTLGRAEPGALTLVQRFGNTLTCGLVRLLWGARFTDLGPFRAIRRDAYERLEMRDPDFGWTIEMQVKAAQQGSRFVEVPVSRRVRRGGESKVTGSVVGSYKAGKRILGYVAEAKLRELGSWDMLRHKLGNILR
ncbi:MAG: glycosyltransferase family 2 protein [Deltaproteobacteria bacterium]|nr:glycosyltransferase family 2 protein [Deltaproteobacteria bacterium]